MQIGYSFEIYSTRFADEPDVGSWEEKKKNQEWSLDLWLEKWASNGAFYWDRKVWARWGEAGSLQGKSNLRFVNLQSFLDIESSCCWYPTQILYSGWYTHPPITEGTTDSLCRTALMKAATSPGDTREVIYPPFPLHPVDQANVRHYLEPHPSPPPPSFIEVWLTSKSCISLRCTTWYFDTCIHCEMITTIKLISYSSPHTVTFCVW